MIRARRRYLARPCTVSSAADVPHRLTVTQFVQGVRRGEQHIQDRAGVGPRRPGRWWRCQRARRVQVRDPANSGKHAYVSNLTNGRTVHLRTDSDAFIEEIRVLAGAGHGSKIRSELVALASAFPDHGWDATEKRLVEAGVFEG